uniref:Uncharacterized protein n=3 Tax=Brassica TaxID=3705 RepID=A0A0D3ANP3_BRAOL
EKRDETERDERLQEKKTETGLSLSPLSQSEFAAPNPKPTLVSLSISSHVCSLGLVLPLQKTDEIHLAWAFGSSGRVRAGSFRMKGGFGGVDYVSQPPRQPGRSNEQTGTSNALAFPGSKSTQKGVTECSCCWSNFTSKGLLCAKRQKMLEDMQKDFEGGQEADKFDGGGGSKSSGSLDIRFRVEKVQAPLCDWKTVTLEYLL